MKMLGSDAILRSLEAEGVDIAFGIPGGAILPLYDAFARGSNVRHVLARHEQGAGHMAEGYARASGKVGVAIATSGPGATNLVTPIADAWMDSTPLVAITGQVRTNLIGTDAFQETDAVGITLPIVKHSWLVQNVEELPGVLKAAFHVAQTGRSGPVHVDIAKDVQEAEFDFRYPEDVDLPGWKPPVRVHPRQIAAAAEALAAAEKPVLYVGGGTINADACAELRELAEAGGIPVITTLMAKGAFPDSHPLAYGAPGMHGSKWANWAMNKCDLLVAVGSRFDDRVTGKLSAFAAGAKVIHLDIDSAEIGKLRRADIPVVGPLKVALGELASQVRKLRTVQRQGPRGLAPADRRVARGVPLPLREERQRSSRRRCSSRCATSPPVATTSSGRPAWASTRCGRCSTSSATGRAHSSPPEGWGRWATASPLPWARRPRAPTRRSSASTATAASR